jgi:hypothetical protein
MKFQTQSNATLHLQFKNLTRTERKITAQILEMLVEIEKRKIYLERGYESLFAYLVKDMKYSEGAASRRIQAMRLLKNHAEVKEKIQSGEMNLTQASMIQTAIRAEKKIYPQNKIAVTEILQNIEGKTRAETQQVLQSHFSEEALKALAPSLLIQKTQNQIRLEIQLSPEEHDLLQKVAALRSTQQTNLKEVILWMANETLRKSKFAEPRPIANPAVGSQCDSERVSLPIQTQRLVFHRARHQCEHTDPMSKRRCRQKKFLEIDHRIPLALDGSNDPDNLRVLCREHNAAAAEEMGLARSFRPE